jgi:hypothetical protein
MLCDVTREDGIRCGETALIHSIKYRVERDYANEFRHILRQTVYEIKCPRCGMRRQVEHYDNE